MSLADITLSDHERTRLKEFFKDGVKTLTTIDGLKEDAKTLTGGLKETAKALGEEIGVDGGQIMKALTIKHKETLEESRENFETIELILAEVGAA